MKAFQTRAIGRIGAGVNGASIAAPVVAGSGQQSTQQVCEGDRWADWAAQQPLVNEFGFDGYQWLRDGTAIAGQTSRTYTLTSADVGHQLTCSVTVTYSLLDVTDSAISAGVTVIAQSSEPTGPQGPQGQTGPPGPQGQTGPPGPAGKVELVTCKTMTKTVTRHDKKVKVKRQQRTTKLVSGRSRSRPRRCPRGRRCRAGGWCTRPATRTTDAPECIRRCWRRADCARGATR